MQAAMANSSDPEASHDCPHVPPHPPQSHLPLLLPHHREDQGEDQGVADEQKVCHARLS